MDPRTIAAANFLLGWLESADRNGPTPTSLCRAALGVSHWAARCHPAPHQTPTLPPLTNQELLSLLTCAARLMRGGVGPGFRLPTLSDTTPECWPVGAEPADLAAFAWQTVATHGQNPSLRALAASGLLLALLGGEGGIQAYAKQMGWPFAALPSDRPHDFAQ